MDLFTRYGPEPPEGTEPPVCVASHPEPCGEAAVGEGWDLPFCEGHWREAEMSAREELADALDNELEILEFAEAQRHHTNKAVVRALRAANVPGLEWGVGDFDACPAARAAAFPVEGRDDLADPEAMAYDYDRYEGDGPTEWWEDERYLLLYFMRRASAAGLPRLMADLEGLRERATAQIVLAYADQQRRYAAPRKAAREAKERAGSRPRTVPDRRSGSFGAPALFLVPMTPGPPGRRRRRLLHGTWRCRS